MIDGQRVYVCMVVQVVALLVLARMICKEIVVNLIMNLKSVWAINMEIVKHLATSYYAELRVTLTYGSTFGLLSLQLLKLIMSSYACPCSPGGTEVCS